MQINIIDIGKNPGLRKTAKDLKQKVLDALELNESVIINFDGVESVSSSFVDELIAKLYVQIGSDTFKNKIKMTNVNDYSKQIIKAAIRDRVKDVA